MSTISDAIARYDDEHSFARSITLAEEDRTKYTSARWEGGYRWFRSLNVVTSHHDEMAAPSKPAQKTARAVEGPRAGAAGNQARVHGERRRGAELDRDL